MSQARVLCVRLPLDGMSLLLPYACVAEIVSLSLRAEDSALLCEVDWRGIRVPVVSLERACGEPIDVPRGRARLAVLYGLHDRERTPYYALLLNGVPRTDSLAAEDIVERADGHGCDLLGMSVEVEGQSLFLPDLQALEAWLGQVRVAA
ncbi:MAG: chemotaxis protein CheW [Pseudomonadota bacterium]